MTPISQLRRRGSADAATGIEALSAGHELMRELLVRCFPCIALSVPMQRQQRPGRRVPVMAVVVDRGCPSRNAGRLSKYTFSRW